MVALCCESEASDASVEACGATEVVPDVFNVVGTVFPLVVVVGGGVVGPCVGGMFWSTPVSDGVKPLLDELLIYHQPQSPSTTITSMIMIAFFDIFLNFYVQLNLVNPLPYSIPNLEIWSLYAKWIKGFNISLQTPEIGVDTGVGCLYEILCPDIGKPQGECCRKYDEYDGVDPDSFELWIA